MKGNTDIEKSIYLDESILKFLDIEISKVLDMCLSINLDKSKKRILLD